MSDSKVKKIVDNMKKIKTPFSTARKILRGFSGAGKLRKEYTAAISPASPSSPVVKPVDGGRTTLVLKNDMSNWNASKNARVKADGDGVKITLPKGGYASGGGVNIKFSPDGIKKSNDVELEYELFLPNTFDFVKGGKIGLGFNINDGTGGKAWRENDGSYRLMWRTGGVCVAYLYLPMDQGKYIPDKNDSPLLKNQGRGFIDAISNKAPAAGLDLFRYTDKKVSFKRGEWNKVKLAARLNDPEKNNGRLELSLNGTSFVVDDMMWTANPRDNMFTQLQLASWFGGGDKSWAAKKDEVIQIRNVTYSFKN